ncbi:MAG: RecQ family ATP-dependent DNA helicase [Deltaproteobacteria bacterium]|nr:RecQ family ATP-dependent DNA helicase [Deltaproteobacteria bacterium]
MTGAARPIDVLKKQFGYASFRLEQEAVINAVLERRDVLAVMPTGGGKSVCYQIPALMLGGITVVISPLIALMKDQVDALTVSGIPAAFLNSSLTEAGQREVFRRLRLGELKLLYVAPERIMSGEGRFIEFMKGQPVSLFAVDEAHCISHWGHDFRPEYLALAALKANFPGVPVVALTASADAVTRGDITAKLGLKGALTFISSFNRANIHYHIRPKRGVYGAVAGYIDRHRDDSGIIYALSRRSVDGIAERLRSDGFSAIPYHAGLDAGTRARHQEMFQRDEIKIIVATIAFGMGIDKSNVRYVMHCDLPKNIESYYQETGRAGRDGLKSDAILFFSRGDVMKLKSFVKIEGNPQRSLIMQKKLDQMARLCEGTVCRRKRLMNYFGEAFGDRCNSCDICLGVHEEVPARPAIKHETRPEAGVEPPEGAQPLQGEEGADFERDLFAELKRLRKAIADEAGVPAYIIFGDSTLVELSSYLPQELADIAAISGFGEVKLEKYGGVFLEAVRAYCVKNSLATRIHLKQPRRRKRSREEIKEKAGTKELSLGLYRAGKSITNIAAERGLKPDTVMGHLAHYIGAGLVGVNELVPPEKIPVIANAVKKNGPNYPGPIKRGLGDNYSYGEITAVINHMRLKGEL